MKDMYGKIKADMRQILGKLCDQKDVEIVQAEACPDHIHMLVCIPPSLSIAQFKEYIDPFAGGKDTKSQLQAALAAARNSFAVGGLFRCILRQGQHYALLGLVQTTRFTRGFVMLL